jgi:hypothetical protein
MAAAPASIKRRRRQKTAEPQVTTVAFPSLAEEHLDIPTLEQWLWDTACAIRGAAAAPELGGEYR